MAPTNTPTADEINIDDRTARELAGWSPRMVAAHARTSTGVVLAYEGGARHLGPPALAALYSALQVHPMVRARRENVAAASKMLDELAKVDPLSDEVIVAAIDIIEKKPKTKAKRRQHA